MQCQKCTNCCMVPDYNNPNDLGGENRIHGKINYEKKMIIHNGMEELAVLIVNQNEKLISTDQVEGLKMICIVKDCEFEDVVEFSWGHATKNDAFTMEELEKVPWTNNLDSVVDYKVPLIMPAVYAFAILASINRHFKKRICENDGTFYI